MGIKGKTFSDEHKRKISESNKGKHINFIPWNKGKTKDDFPQMSNSGVKKGNISWNKGTSGIMKANSGSFKKGSVPLVPFEKGHIPWNKGTKYNQYLIDKIKISRQPYILTSKKRQMVNCICSICGEEYLRSQYQIEKDEKKYCSKKCASLSRRKGKYVKCQTCGKEFWVQAYKLEEKYLKNVGETKYCSMECAKSTQIKKGDKPWNKDIPWSNEVRGKFKETWAKRLLTYKSSDHPNWQGGKSFEPYPVSFNNSLKRYIADRDNHTCQLCGKTENEVGYKLCKHHIDYDKNNCDEKNLISLCRSCHTTTDFNREFWTLVFQELISQIYS